MSSRPATTADEAYEKGNAFFKNSQFERSIFWYTHALNCLPKNHNDRTILLSHRAHSLMNMKRYQECLQDCAQVISEAYQHRDYAFQSSSPLLSKAKTSCKEQLVRAHNIKAQVHIQLNQYTEAIEVYNKVINLDGSLVLTLSARITHCRQIIKEEGDTLLRQDKFMEAENKYKTILSIIGFDDGDLIVTLNDIATCLLMQQNYTEFFRYCDLATIFAERSIRQLMPISPLMEKYGYTFELLLLVASLREKAGKLESVEKYQEAAGVYKSIRAIDNRYQTKANESIEWCKLASLWKEGDSHYIKGMFSKAEEIYTTAIAALPKNDPNLILFLSNRAAALMNQEKYDACLKDCNTAHQIITESEFSDEAPTTKLMKKADVSFEYLVLELLRSQAKSYESLKQYQVAIDTYNIIRSRLGPDNDSARCFLLLKKQQGDAGFKEGRFSEAEACFTAAINSLPEGHRETVLYLSSRAATFLAWGKERACLKDCSSAIRLAQNQIKNGITSTPIMKIENTSAKIILTQLLICQAHAFDALGEHQGALESFRLATSRYIGQQLRDSLTISNGRGNIFYKARQFRQAEKEYTAFINNLSEKNKNYLAFLNNRAASFMQQGNYGKCLEDSNSAILLAYDLIKKYTFFAPNSEQKLELENQLIKALNCRLNVLQRLQTCESAIVPDDLGTKLLEYIEKEGKEKFENYSLNVN